MSNISPISRKLKFYKEADERWYVELPEWKGSKADLEMVAGADTMLNFMSEGEDHINLYLSEEFLSGTDKLEFVRMATEIGNGAHYIMKSYRDIEFNLPLWICDVTLLVFNNRFPETIYVLKYDTEL